MIITLYHNRRSFMMAGVLFLATQSHAHEMSGSYAKLLSMQVSDDISASGLRGDGDAYRKVSVPWHSDCLWENSSTCAGIWLRGSYMNMKSDAEEDGLFQWEAYGVSVGADMTVRLSEILSLRGGLGVGYSRVYNRRHGLENYDAVLGWMHKNVLFVLPEVEGIITLGDFSLRPGLSFLSASELSSGHRDIGARAGSYTLRTSYTFRNAFRLPGGTGNIVIGNNTGGFYGAGYRKDLTFSLVNETHILADIPFTWGGRSLYIQSGPGLLLADNGARGMSFTFSLKM